MGIRLRVLRSGVSRGRLSQKALSEVAWRVEMRLHFLDDDLQTRSGLLALVLFLPCARIVPFRTDHGTGLGLNRVFVGSLHEM